MIDYYKVAKHIQAERLQKAQRHALIQQSKPSFRENLASCLYRWAKHIEPNKRTTTNKRVNS